MSNIMRPNQRYIGIRDGWYTGSDMVNQANRSHWEGAAAMLEVIRCLNRLSGLLTEILDIAAYSEHTLQIKTRLTDIAKQRTGRADADLKDLAADITGCLDAFNIVSNQRFGVGLDAMPDIPKCALPVRKALLAWIDGDDGVILRSPEILQLKGMIAKWEVPQEWDTGGRPTGMGKERKWLAEKVQERKKRKHPHGYWGIGLEIFRELRLTPEPRTDEQQYAYNQLKIYMSEDEQWVTQKAEMRDYLSRLTRDLLKL